MIRVQVVVHSYFPCIFLQCEYTFSVTCIYSLTQQLLFLFQKNTPKRKINTVYDGEQKENFEMVKKKRHSDTKEVSCSKFQYASLNIYA